MKQRAYRKAKPTYRDTRWEPVLESDAEPANGDVPSYRAGDPQAGATNAVPAASPAEGDESVSWLHRATGQHDQMIDDRVSIPGRRPWC